jgi:hypothetical protein
MRLLVVMLVALAGCPAGSNTDKALGNGSNVGGGEGAIPECNQDSDCSAAGLKCCDCPTYAVPARDPAVNACMGVMCPAQTCPDNVRAACSGGACVLACKLLAYNLTCNNGYIIDASGCEECACAGPSGGACAVDSDCVRVRADCCGCAGGGTDTSVPAGDAAAHDAALMCPSNPRCTGTDSCPVDQAPACVQGSCELVSPLPVAACGRPDLMACAPGQTCTLNADDGATDRGLGVCM